MEENPYKAPVANGAVSAKRFVWLWPILIVAFLACMVGTAFFAAILVAAHAEQMREDEEVRRGMEKAGLSQNK